MAVVTLMSVATEFISARAGAVGERCEPLLLIVVKALVKRLCRIGQFAQCCAGVVAPLKLSAIITLEHGAPG